MSDKGEILEWLMRIQNKDEYADYEDVDELLQMVRPRVSKKALFNLVFAGHPGMTMHALQSFLEGIGFEVDDDA